MAPSCVVVSAPREVDWKAAIWVVASAGSSVVVKAPSCVALRTAICAVLKAWMSVVVRLAMTVVLRPATCVVVRDEMILIGSSPCLKAPLLRRKTNYATAKFERDPCRTRVRPAMRLRSWISSILLPGLHSRRPIAAASRGTASPIRKFAANHPATTGDCGPTLVGAEPKTLRMMSVWKCSWMESE